MVRAGSLTWRHRYLGHGQIGEQRLNQSTIKEPMVELIPVAHETVVARSLTIFAGARRSPHVFTRIRVVVTKCQCMSRHAAQSS